METVPTLRGLLHVGLLPKPLLATLALSPLVALALPALISRAQTDPSALESPPPQPTAAPPPQVPRRAGPSFDQSLDALERSGVITAAERRRVINGGGQRINLPAMTNEACRRGALSRQECQLGFSLSWRGRDGNNADLAGGRIGADGRPLPPLTVPVSALLTGAGGSFRLADVFRVTPRPAPLAGNGNRSLLLPLIGEAAVSSSFGWRLHPLLGNWLLHSGRDLAAPEGTPVVAALEGTVISSGLAGGYGLAIEVEHRNPARRTLYGHLSELYVRAGERVRQGEVIGRVGSTGLSTGPHLHFEVRLPSDGGWVAVEPGELDPGRGTQRMDPVALLFGQLVQSLERPRRS